MAAIDQFRRAHGITEKLRRINGNSTRHNIVYWRKEKAISVRYDQYSEWNRTRQTVDVELGKNVIATSSSKKYQVSKSNLIFIKVPKVGSSTVGGVARRIAAHHKISGSRDSTWILNEPGVWANHGKFEGIAPNIKLLHLPVFIFTIVREPASRCLSEFYHFQVSRKQVLDTAENKLAFLNSSCSNVQFEYVRAGKGVTTVDKVLRRYDFVGILEQIEDTIYQNQEFLVEARQKQMKYFRNPTQIYHFFTDLISMLCVRLLL